MDAPAVGAAAEALALSVGKVPGGPTYWAPVAVATGAALLFFAALYHRLRRETLLLNRTRAAVYEAIRAEPGVRGGTVARRLGLDPTTVEHHVDLLRKFRLVEALEGGQRRLFVAGADRPHDVAREVAASAPSARVILEQVRQGGRWEFRELRMALGLKASTASEAVDRLAAAGLVTKEWLGGRLWVAMAERGEAT